MLPSSFKRCHLDHAGADNIEIDIKIVSEGTGFTELAQDGAQWRTSVNVVTKLRVL